MEYYLTNYEKKLIQKVRQNKHLSEEEIDVLKSIYIPVKKGRSIQYEPLVLSYDKKSVVLNPNFNEDVNTLLDPLENLKRFSIISEKRLQHELGTHDVDKMLTSLGVTFKVFEPNGETYYYLLQEKTEKEPIYFNVLTGHLVVSNEKLQEFKDKFKINVEEEIAKMEAWLKEKGRYRNYTDFEKFITNWLKRNAQGEEFVNKFYSTYEKIKQMPPPAKYYKYAKELKDRIIKSGYTVEEFLKLLFTNNGFYASKSTSIPFVYNHFDQILVELQKARYSSKMTSNDRQLVFKKNGRQVVIHLDELNEPEKVFVDGQEIPKSDWEEWI
jgi:hypothetical protein